MIPILASLLTSAIPSLGEVAPDFTVTDVDGKVWHLDEAVKHGTVILAFFPKAFTGGCTSELTQYREKYADVLKAKGQVLAVSTDAPEKQRKFKESLNAPFAFIADEKGQLVKLYDVKMPLLSMAQRYTFVIGEGRKVLAIQKGMDALRPEGAISACPLTHAPAK